MFHNIKQDNLDYLHVIRRILTVCLLIMNKIILWLVCLIRVKMSTLVGITLVNVDFERISVLGDLCCLTKLGSLSWCVGGNWLVVRLHFQTQMAEVHRMENLQEKLKAFKLGKKQTHPSLRGAPRLTSLGSRRVDDSSSKLGSSICRVR